MFVNDKILKLKISIKSNNKKNSIYLVDSFKLLSKKFTFIKFRLWMYTTKRLFSSFIC